MDTQVLDPENVLQSLTKAWQEHATVGGGDSVVRAGTLNLLIFSPDPAQAVDIGNILPQVVQQHPCRAIHIQIDAARTDSSLNAWTQVYTRTLEGGVRQLSCEQVTIAASGDIVGLQGAVLPLLQPDLPVYLWWRGDPPFEGSLFESLVAASDSMLFDSADFREPDEDLAWLAQVVKSQPFEIAYSDVNWARLTSWRGLIAQFFDTAEARAVLPQLQEVRVHYCDDYPRDGRVASQAWLLAGWLAARLGWKPAGASSQKDGATVVSLQGEAGQSINLYLQRETCNFDGYRGLTAVDLMVGPPRTRRYRVEYLGDQGAARTVVAVADTPTVDRVVKMDEISDAALISREFESPGRDRSYEEALHASVLLAGVDVNG